MTKTKNTIEEKIKQKELNFDWICKLKNVDEMFSLVVANNYVSGKFGSKATINENKKVFEVIKDKIRQKTLNQVKKIIEENVWNLTVRKEVLKQIQELLPNNK